MGDARPDWDPDQVMDSTKVPDGVVDLPEISSGFLDDDMEYILRRILWRLAYEGIEGAGSMGGGALAAFFLYFGSVVVVCRWVWPVLFSLGFWERG